MFDTFKCHITYVMLRTLINNDGRALKVQEK